jgi:hypothetical protein
MQTHLFNTVPSMPIMRPMFNVGCGIDIVTGTYHTGRYGESILSGGLSASQSVIGPPNANKTTLIAFMNLAVCENIDDYKWNLYDTEISGNYSRIRQLSIPFPKMSQIPHGDPTLDAMEAKVLITSSNDILGDAYFQKVTQFGESRKKLKEVKNDTPFLDGMGGYIKLLKPVGIGIDSLSEFKTSYIEENYTEKNKIGDSGNNMMYARGGIARKQLLQQIPHTAANGGFLFTMTAHVGLEFNMDPKAAKKPGLTHSKRGVQTKGTTGNFDYLNGYIAEIWDATPLNNKEYKTGVLYPKDENDKAEDCVDLVKISVHFSRNKTGQSGGYLDIVVSQRDGIQPHLTLFHACKDEDRFGLEITRTIPYPFYRTSASVEPPLEIR